MDFKLTGIAISMDVAMIVTAIALIYAWSKDRHEKIQKQIDAVNQLMLNQIQQWNPLIDAFFNKIKSNDLTGLHLIHNEIWNKLKELRMLAAAEAQKETYDTLAKHIDAYKSHMTSHGGADAKKGLIELGKMLRSMMALMQKNEEVLDSYFNDRFGESMRNSSA